MKEKCFCLVEGLTYVGIMGVIDTMMKAADVELVWCTKINAGMMTACFHGDLGSVKIAVDAERNLSKEKGFELREVILSRPDPVIAKFLAEGT